MTTRTTEVKVIEQGLVKLSHNDGYCVIGNDQIIGFFVDTDIRAYDTAASIHDDGYPIIWICHNPNKLYEVETVIGFPEFKGYSIHSTHGGKSLAIALINNNAFK